MSAPNGPVVLGIHTRSAPSLWTLPRLSSDPSLQQTLNSPTPNKHRHERLPLGRYAAGFGRHWHITFTELLPLGRYAAGFGRHWHITFTELLPLGRYAAGFGRHWHTTFTELLPLGRYAAGFGRHWHTTFTLNMSALGTGATLLSNVTGPEFGPTMVGTAVQGSDPPGQPRLLLSRNVLGHRHS